MKPGAGATTRTCCVSRDSSYMHYIQAFRRKTSQQFRATALQLVRTIAILRWVQGITHGEQGETLAAAERHPGLLNSMTIWRASLLLLCLWPRHLSEQLVRELCFVAVSKSAEPSHCHCHCHCRQPADSAEPSD